MKEWIVEECPGLTLDGKILSTMLRREQELIRCKDCKFMYEDDVFQCAIKDGYFPVHEEWFCADGERRNEVKNDE